MFDYDNPSGINYTVISKSTTVRGNIKTADPIKVSGRVIGDIDCEKRAAVTGKVEGNIGSENFVASNAAVKGNNDCHDQFSADEDSAIIGDVTAGAATVEGRVKGNMKIANEVEVGSTAVIVGDISASNIEVKKGARVSGTLQIDH